MRECHRAGIRVTMITGDHAATAGEIGAQLGIGTGRPVVTGAEIAALDDAQLRSVALDCDVFARASPEHKLRLVRALQAGGEVVAMTGDGVNDSPALKKADIGVAMGHKGTEAAKEAADMVLADDNFATIAAAVAEGRTVYDNIRKFVLFMLPTNGGEALVVIAAIMFQITLPLTPAQVLWINLATSATLGLALAFEPPEADVMGRQPRPPGESLLSRYFAWRVALVSVLMAAGALSLFLWELNRGTSIETARTMAVNAIVVAEMFYLLNNRFLLRPVLNRIGLFGNKIALATVVACGALQLAFTYAPFMNQVFGSTPLGYGEWLRAAGVGVLVFSVVEVEKFVRRRRLSRRRSPVRKCRWRRDSHVRADSHRGRSARRAPSPTGSRDRHRPRLRRPGRHRRGDDRPRSPIRTRIPRRHDRYRRLQGPPDGGHRRTGQHGGGDQGAVRVGGRGTGRGSPPMARRPAGPLPPPHSPVPVLRGRPQSDSGLTGAGSAGRSERRGIAPRDPRRGSAGDRAARRHSAQSRGHRPHAVDGGDHGGIADPSPGLQTTRPAQLPRPGYASDRRGRTVAHRHHGTPERHRSRTRGKPENVTVIARHGVVDEVLPEYVSRHGVDLVVIGVPPRRGLAHWLLGSTATRLLRHLPCSVLAVKTSPHPSRRPS